VENTSGIYAIKGLSGKLINEAAKRMNFRFNRFIIKYCQLTLVKTWLIFSYSVAKPADGTWGSPLDNGSWSGMIGMIIRNVINYFISNIYSVLNLFFLKGVRLFSGTFCYNRWKDWCIWLFSTIVSILCFYSNSYWSKLNNQKRFVVYTNCWPSHLDSVNYFNNSNFNFEICSKFIVKVDIRSDILFNFNQNFKIYWIFGYMLKSYSQTLQNML